MSQYFDYLNDLRDSGETNMWLASSYLEAEFGLDRKEAKDILLSWIRSFSKQHYLQAHSAEWVCGLMLAVLGGTMETKTFDGFFKPVKLTKQQFIDRWVDTTNQMTGMFFEADQIDALRDFQHKLYEVSGMAWDRQKEDV